ncbi:YbdD/YjiX family protein [Streptomyces smyrnaeus]|uniref:YbdD/YjiX family protein n=1 Tax=Streptomyces TaxID=1883 RepID=UPI000C192270|nr:MULTISPECIES: YbdD/YjiX family protein [unclassified Streptomyces]MBQ0867968.1 YbdD/YjiX family protein [Streptomyces sp. RK75]MBQ1123992.1 YbdD/YjiX family protein [Streptomyces sp. B15]MBQ1159303.1 YbdD/YjiX family protein [Streptomyces sp. A73]
MSGPRDVRTTNPVLRAGRWLRWYVREFTDESAYERYVAHVRQHQGPDAEIPSRKEFERRRTDAREGDPREGFRCC